MNEKEMKKKLKQAYDLLLLSRDSIPCIDYNFKTLDKIEKWIHDYEEVKKNER